MEGQAQAGKGLAPAQADQGTEIAELRGQLGEMSKSLAQLGGMFQTMLGHQQAPVEKPAEQPQDVWPDDPELESMTRRQHDEFLLKHIQTMVAKQVLEPVQKDLASVRGEFQKAQAASSIERIQAQHKDLNEWTDELREVLGNQKVPDLQSAYLTVRAANPEKAKSLDVKYAPAPAPTDDDNSTLLQFLPARPGARPGDAAPGRLSLDEASEASFNKLGGPILKEIEQLADQSLTASV